MTVNNDKEYNKLESKFYDSFREHLQGCHTQRIETTTGPGVPDINICRNGIELWVELKMVITQGVLLRKEQFAWHTIRAFRGGKVFVIAKYPDRNLFLVWKTPYKVEEYNEKYLRIISQPHTFTIYNDMINFLFTIH